MSEKSPRRGRFTRSFHPGSPFIRSSAKMDMDDIVHRAAKIYVDTTNHMRETINEALFPLYGRNLNIPESNLSDTVDKLRVIQKETGKTMPEIGREIRKYLGFDCIFYRKSGDKQVPVERSRLVKAYKAVLAREDKNFIKAYLYF